MSKGNEHIDDIIKGGFGEDDGDFDFSSWSKIEQKLDGSSSIDSQIKTAFTAIPVEEPHEAWEGISEDLDIDTVWRRLEGRRRRRPVAIWWTAAAVGLLLVYTLFQMDVFNANEQSNSSKNVQGSEIDNIESEGNSDFTPVNKADNEEASSNFGTNDEVRSNEIIESEANENTIANVSIETNSNVNENTDQITTNSRPDDVNVSIKDVRVDLSKLPNKDVNPLPHLYHIPSINIPLVGFDSTTSPPEKIRRWTVGLVAGLDNTWILDATTRQGFKKNTLTINKLSFQSSYGIFGTFHMNKGYSLSSELFFHTNSVATNRLYVEGNFEEKELSLRYWKATLMLGKKYPLIKSNKNLFWNLNTGVYAGYLRDNETKYDGIIKAKESPYKKGDFGIKAELGLIRNFNRLNLQYGVHSDIGLINVYAGNQKLPELFNRSRNFRLGFYLRLGFNL
ncbi:hypothetical protein JYT74_03670 [Crocinitomix catalasitica]|nr:hypothetical protein [Crocinitomix catalasitica]MBN4077602.1 hypothetical protein [bacterium AH-315-C20]